MPTFYNLILYIVLHYTVLILYSFNDVIPSPYTLFPSITYGYIRIPKTVFTDSEIWNLELLRNYANGIAEKRIPGLRCLTALRQWGTRDTGVTMPNGKRREGYRGTMPNGIRREGYRGTMPNGIRREKTENNGVYGVTSSIPYSPLPPADRHPARSGGSPAPPFLIGTAPLASAARAIPCHICGRCPAMPRLHLRNAGIQRAGLVWPAVSHFKPV